MFTIIIWRREVFKVGAIFCKLFLAKIIRKKIRISVDSRMLGSRWQNSFSPECQLCEHSPSHIILGCALQGITLLFVRGFFFKGKKATFFCSHPKFAINGSKTAEKVINFWRKKKRYMCPQYTGFHPTETVLKCDILTL